MRWLCGLLLACGGPTEPALRAPTRAGWVEQVDWSVAQDEAVGLLSSYLAVDTSNPPGREADGVAVLAARLEAEGIAVEVLPFAEGRHNLVARLPGRGELPPLCLVSHVDVATAEAERWEVPPFEGRVEEGMVWGRGAIDMKSVGVVELLSMVWLKRLGVPLTREVILVAVGDEEVGNTGMAHLIEHHWDRIGCSHALNEGGLGVRGGLLPGVQTFTVSFAEKGSLWVRMVATGPPGHGSTPLPDAAPARLQRALSRIDALPDEPRVHPELRRLLAAVGSRAGGVEGWALQTPWATDAFAMGELLADPLARATVTDTINVTGFGGAEAPNVVPAEVWAQLDIRLLPGSRAEAMLERLRAAVDDPSIRFEVLSSSEARESPTDDPVFTAAAAELQRAFPEAAVGPLVMMGSTDSQALRALGVHAYGVAPFLFDPEELRGMHGDNERIGVDNLGRGLEVMFRIVLEVAAAADRG